MEPVIDYLKRKLREAGAANWPAIADVVNEGLAEDRRIGSALLRKIAYGDRDNPGVQTVQPLLDYFGAVDRGERKLPAEAEAASERCTQQKTSGGELNGSGKAALIASR